MIVPLGDVEVKGSIQITRQVRWIKNLDQNPDVQGIELSLEGEHLSDSFVNSWFLFCSCCFSSFFFLFLLLIILLFFCFFSFFSVFWCSLVVLVFMLLLLQLTSAPTAATSHQVSLSLHDLLHLDGLRGL